MEADLRKQDDELQMVWAEVYAPNRPDVHGEYMTPEDIKVMAYRFMIKKMSGAGAVDVQHNNDADRDLIVFESFIAREGDPDFIPGSWVVGVHVKNPEVWAKVKKGELNSFSVEAMVAKQEDEVTLEIPDVVTGSTSEAAGHRHTFEVHYDDKGNFVGGRTSVEAGHFHNIKTGTVTDAVNGHRHKFSSIENIKMLQES